MARLEHIACFFSREQAKRQKGLATQRRPAIWAREKSPGYPRDDVSRAKLRGGVTVLRMSRHICNLTYAAIRAA